MAGFDARSPDRWSLRPGDLPPPDLLDAEPRLRGLEDNAVYRLLKRRQRRSVLPAWRGCSTVFYAVFSVLYAWMIWAGIMKGLTAWLMLGCFGFMAVLDAIDRIVTLWIDARNQPAARIPFPSTRTQRPPLSQFTRTEIADLLVAGVPPADVVAGFWGVGVSARGAGGFRRIGIRFLVASAVAFAIAAAWFGPGASPEARAAAWTPTCLLMFFGALLCAISLGPRADRALYFALRGLRWTIPGRAGLPAGVWQAGAFFALGYVCAMSAAMALVVAPAPYLAVAVHPLALLVVVPALGTVAGRVFAGGRRHRDRDFEEAVSIVARLLEDSRREIFESS